MLTWNTKPRSRFRSDFAEYPARRAAVREARRHTRAVLIKWGMTGLAADTESVIAELAANAVEAHERERRHDPFGIKLVGQARTILISVRDASPRPPVLASPGADEEAGRGLLIVDELAARWSYRLGPGDGKTIHVLLRDTHQEGSTTS